MSAEFTQAVRAAMVSRIDNSEFSDCWFSLFAPALELAVRP